MKLTVFLRSENPGCSGWGLEIEVLVFMFWLASATSYRVVSRAFDIPRTTVHDIVHKVAQRILRLKGRVIAFPCAMELDAIGDGFAQLAGSPAFSKAVGSIDGCQVRIKPPSRDQSCYLNRKLFFSVQIQAICNHKGRFLDIFVGYPGSVHDARVYRNSPICAKNLYPPEGYILLGDGGYPCTKSLITPYREPVPGAVERRFNFHHAKARSIIERAFGIMKTRWRTIFLKALEVKPTFAPVVIACCAILHNIAIDAGDLLEPLEEAVRGDDNQDQPQPLQLDPSGEEVRRQLAAAVLDPMQVALEQHDYL